MKMSNDELIVGLHYKQESKSNPDLSFELEIDRCFASEEYKMFILHSNQGNIQKRISPKQLVNAARYFKKSDISSWDNAKIPTSDIHWEVAINLGGKVARKEGNSAIKDAMKAMYFVNAMKELFLGCDIKPIDNWDTVFLYRNSFNGKKNFKFNWLSKLFH